MSIEAIGQGIAYARYTRRLKAFFLDWVLMIALMFGGLLIAVSFGSDNVARPLGFIVLAVLLLYEPLLVSMTGSTVGHYVYNLRVVDDRTGGNPSFVKAVGRVVIKSVLGIYSFISMATTRRRQAVHDLLTRSTVQVRDAAKANPEHYAGEDLELVSPGMPSTLQRLAVIAGYLVAWLLVVTLLLQPAVVTLGLISNACLEHDRCSKAEDAVTVAVGLVFLVVCVICIIRGWRGRLWGARARPEAR
jgi:uncharacterized RDD family membrane protein YckC